MTKASEFWQLLEQSRLLRADQLAQFQQGYQSMKGATRDNSARVLGEWLVSENALSRYQMKVMLAGRPGPFYFGDYCIGDRFDGGRLGEVFQARHAPTGHPVWLCFLTGPVADRNELWARAAQAAERQRALNLPQLQQFYELIDLTSFRFAALEALPGECLQKLAAGRPVPLAEACKIARQVAMALESLHRSGQPYGELRPENIWLTAARNAKLMRPPLAHPLETPPGFFSLADQSQSNTTLKKADYVAPELARPGAMATPASDLYALGCTLYEMLAGEPPFAGGTAVEKVHRHATAPIQPLTSRGVPDQLAQVVTYLMAKDPSVRYQQAQQVVGALAPFVDPAALQAPAESPASTQHAYLQHVAQQQAQLTGQATAAQPLPEIQSTVGRSAPRPVTSGNGEASAPAFGGLEASENGSTAARLAQRRQKSPMGLVVGVAAAALIGLGIWMLGGSRPYGSDGENQVANSGDDRTANGDTATPASSSDVSASKVSSSNGGSSTTASGGSDSSSGGTRSTGAEDGGTSPATLIRETRVQDNGLYLWASPTSGPPLDLEYLPPGGQIYISFRPAALLRSPEGDKIRYAMGPTGESHFTQLENLTGLSHDDIEQVLISLEATPGGTLESALRVTLRETMPPAELIALWPGATESRHKDHTFHQRGGWAYYLPPDAAGRVFAITTVPKFRGWADVGLGPPPLRREMEEMLADTDSNRVFNCLFAPNILFTDAQKAVFAGGMSGLRQPLFDFFGDDTLKSGLLSLHVDQDNFFVELRLGGTIDVPPQELAKGVHERITELPRQLRRFYTRMSPHPWSLDVLAEFPYWVETFGKYTRSDEANGQAVLRTYLPAIAAHNLVGGIELTLAQLGGTGAGPAVASAGPKEQGPRSIEEILKSNATLSFPRDTLEISMQLLADELGVEIILLGSDLKLDGITKNQSFGIEMRDMPAEEILTKVMMLANPDKSVTKPSEPGQKLVYVIGPKEDGSEEKVIYITTRQMADKRGELPEQFKLQEE